MRIAAVLFILAAALFCVWVYARAQNASPQLPAVVQPPVVNQGPGSTFSYGQQGGVTAGTLNLGPIPRQILSDEAGIISLSLIKSRTNGNISVETGTIGCWDCDRLATQIEGIFRSVPGYTVKSVRHGILGFPYKGVAVGVRSKNSIPDCAKAIVDAFHNAGFNIGLIEFTPAEGSDAALVVFESST
jgi:hypothetical protein